MGGRSPADPAARLVQGSPRPAPCMYTHTLPSSPHPVAPGPGPRGTPVPEAEGAFNVDEVARFLQQRGPCLRHMLSSWSLDDPSHPRT